MNSFEVMAERKLEIANEFAERREALQTLERFNEIEDQCIDCHRPAEPGETFDADFAPTEGLICIGCKETRMEAENLEASSLMDTLSRWFTQADRAGDRVKVPLDELREAIREAAWQESYTGILPWESGAEYDIRRLSGRRA